MIPLNHLFCSVNPWSHKQKNNPSVGEVYIWHWARAYLCISAIPNGIGTPRILQQHANGKCQQYRRCLPFQVICIQSANYSKVCIDFVEGLVMLCLDISSIQKTVFIRTKGFLLFSFAIQFCSHFHILDSIHKKRRISFVLPLLLSCPFAPTFTCF